ncbi:hypothetical protein BH18ACT4_BH18ACT4_05580 [soil metagenome]
MRSASRTLDSRWVTDEEERAAAHPVAAPTTIAGVALVGAGR